MRFSADGAVRKTAIGVCLALGLVLASCSGSGGPDKTASDNTAMPSGSYTLTVAYGSDYVFDTDALASQWWNQVANELEAAHPNIKVKLIPIPGGYNEIVSKLSLLYRSASTAPDVAEIPSPLVGLWAQAGYLLPLDKYLQKTSWWSTFPTSVRAEGTLGNVTYAVNHGGNDVGLLYNKKMFQEAGIPTPWDPKNWQDILSAAEKLKTALPNVTPLWLNAGTSAGADDELYGIDNLIVGTQTPTIQDTKTGKFVVDSPGIQQSLSFYKTAFEDGLTPPVSQLFSSAPVQLPANYFAEGKLGMCLCGNWFPGGWTKTVSAPYWPQYEQDMAVAPLPSNYGTGQPASELGGWDLAVSKTTTYPQVAMDFLDQAENETNTIDAANWAGWVPPQTTYASAPGYANFSSPFNKIFADIQPYAVISPPSSGYSVWAQGMGEATEAIAEKPSTTVSQAISILTNYVNNQLGSNQTETIP
jgi:multiple sugar transport system substrate-binding protein